MSTEPEFDMESEEMRARPLCVLCGGRNTRWSSVEEDDPRETVYCFTCGTAPLLPPHPPARHPEPKP